MELAAIAERLTERRNYRDYVEIAQVLGIPKTSAFRLVKKLENAGLLRLESVRTISILPPETQCNNGEAL